MFSRITCGIVIFIAGLVQPAMAMSLKEAVRLAITTHPSVLAAAAKKRARDAQVEQANSRLYPTLKLDGDIGYEYIDQPGSLSVTNNAQWQNRKQIGATLRYVLFDGLDRANKIYYRAARSDAASRRVMVATEKAALDAVEAYIDHRRYRFLLKIANQTVSAHQRILQTARARVSGGKAAASEVDVVLERLLAAKAARSEVLRSALEADARFKFIVGVEPKNTRKVRWPKGIPATKELARKIAIANNPLIAATAADADAFGYEAERLRGNSPPELAIEGSASLGQDIGGSPGKSNSARVLLKLRWTLFDGNLRKYERDEARELQAESTLKRDLEIRKISESIDRTWAAVATGNEQNALIKRQSKRARAIAKAYRREYQAGKRTLVDLLLSENAAFNTRFESVSAAGVQLFNAYRLKALTSTLISSLGLVAPDEANSNYRSRIPTYTSGFNITVKPLRTDR